MRALIADDDKEYASFIGKGLGRSGFEVDHAYDGEGAYLLAKRHRYDVVILDVVMPKRDGYSVLLSLRREKYPAAILMATSRSGEKDRMSGFDNGADDYLVKPIYLSELLARIRRILGRISSSEFGIPTSTLRTPNSALNSLRTPNSALSNDPDLLVAGDLRLDSRRFHAERSGRPIRLTRKEFELLEFFMRRPGRVLSQPVIIQQVWNLDFDCESKIVEQHIHNLRIKLGDARGKLTPPPDQTPKDGGRQTPGDRSGGGVIQTMRGFGYVFEPRM
jgi:DNA-binding response OmpR family regulator